MPYDSTEITIRGLEMSDIIFKSTPGQEIVRLDLDRDLKFFGPDVKTIVVGNTNHGSILKLEAVDSLDNITLETPGSVILFKERPKNTVTINGRPNDVKIHYQSRTHSLLQNKANRTIPFTHEDQVIISSNVPVGNHAQASLILMPNEVEDLLIEQEFSNLLIVGDEYLRSITINGNMTIERLFIENIPNLNSIRIHKRVLTCSVSRCKKIEIISGFGDRLLISGPKKKNLCIGGFWHEVPVWYDEFVSMLAISHFKAHLTSEDVYSCNDMGGITVIPFSYDGKAGLCEFSQKFEWPIETLDEGIPIPKIIEMIMQDNDRFEVFAAWCGNNLSLFQQYIAMRVLSSLSAKGFNQDRIFKLRNSLLTLNSMMPKILNSSVNMVGFGGQWNPLYASDAEHWEVPNNTVMPFGRLDLEIWLNSDKTIPQMLDESFHFKRMNTANGQFRISKSHAFRSLIVSILSAANTCSRTDAAEDKLTELAKSLYTNPKINSDPFICEFTILHIASSRVISKSIVKLLVKAIAGMFVQPWVRAALLIGVIDQTNSSKARIALQRIASDKEFSLEESDIFSRIALEGKNALGNGNFDRPKWPYVENWRKIRRKIY